MQQKERAINKTGETNPKQNNENLKMKFPQPTKSQKYTEPLNRTNSAPADDDLEKTRTLHMIKETLADSNNPNKKKSLNRDSTNFIPPITANQPSHVAKKPEGKPTVNFQKGPNPPIESVNVTHQKPQKTSIDTNQDKKEKKMKISAKSFETKIEVTNPLDALNPDKLIPNRSRLTSEDHNQEHSKRSSQEMHPDDKKADVENTLITHKEILIQKKVAASAETEHVQGENGDSNNPEAHPEQILEEEEKNVEDKHRNTLASPNESEEINAPNHDNGHIQPTPEITEKPNPVEEKLTPVEGKPAAVEEKPPQRQVLSSIKRQTIVSLIENFSRNLESYRKDYKHGFVPKELIQLYERPYTEVPLRGGKGNHDNRIICPVFIIGEPKDNKSWRQPIDPRSDEIGRRMNVWLAEIKQIGNTEEKKELNLKLNQLTPDNYDKIFKDILNLAKKGQDLCKYLVTRIMEKAWMQQKYRKVYAKLCSELVSDKTLSPDQPSGAGENSKNKNQFKTELLTSIQSVFEGDSKEFLEAKKSFEEMNDQEKNEFLSKRRKKIFGNVFFIGELYIVKVISRKIIQVCTTTLLTKVQDAYREYKAKKVSKMDEDSFEAIINLYDKIGKNIDLDEGNPKKKSSKGPKGTSNLKETIKKNILCINNGKSNEEKSLEEENEKDLSVKELFEILEYLVSQCNISTRLKCLLKNLQERKANQWAETVSTEKGPKTIKAIREEHDKELNDQMKPQQYQMDSSFPRPEKKKNQPAKFQVHGGDSKSNAQVAQAEVPMSQSNVGMQANFGISVSLNFDVDRGKKSSVVVQNSLSIEKIQERIKVVFEKWRSGFEFKDNDEENKISYDSEKGLKDTIEIVKNSEQDNFLSAFFRTFISDDYNRDSVEKWLNLPIKLNDQKIITKDKFLKNFLDFSSKEAVGLFTDNHFVSEALARMYYDFVKIGELKVSEMKLDKGDTTDEDELEEKMYFFEALIAKLEKLDDSQAHANDIKVLKAQIGLK